MVLLKKLPNRQLFRIAHNVAGDKIDRPIRCVAVKYFYQGHEIQSPRRRCCWPDGRDRPARLLGLGHPLQSRQPEIVSAVHERLITLADDPVGFIDIVRTGAANGLARKQESCVKTLWRQLSNLSLVR